MESPSKEGFEIRQIDPDRSILPSQGRCTHCSTRGRSWAWKTFTIGDSAAAQKGDDVAMSYVGTLEADGSRFDAGKDFRFTLRRGRRHQGLGSGHRRHARRRPPQARRAQ